MSSYKLELFYFSSCPYCKKVLRVIEELGLDIELKNTMEERANLDRLFKDTGRKTVPCLYINKKPMHESSDIIQWLQEHEADLKKK